MFLDTVSGQVTGLAPNDHTRFQCSVSLTVPLESVAHIAPGLLIAAENLHNKARDKHFTVLQLIHVFPEEPAKGKVAKGVTFQCKATPIGIELLSKGKKLNEIEASDTYPAYGAGVFALDDETTAAVLHQIAPESRSQENGSRVDIGNYGTNPGVPVGLDYTTLIRGNAAVISSRPRARTTITNNLISALLEGAEHPIHVVYCDVNNQGSLSLMNLIHTFENTLVLGLNDKFVPQSIFHSLKQPGDRQLHKRAVLDYLDMMIMPSALEQRRHDLIYPVSQLLRGDKFAIYRTHEQTVDEFINEIRIDILEGADSEVEEYITDVLDGMAATYQGERFNDKNTKDILDMIDEFSQEAKIHAARRTLYDVRGEVQSAFESFSKDIPGTSRKTLSDIVYRLNDETKSSFTVVQGQKTTDILRFAGSLVQGLVDERLKRLKIRVPVLFIFNNADEYIPRTVGGSREAGGDRFQDILQTMLANGRRHGLGFCMTLEQASALEGSLARRIQSFFIGTLRFREEPEKAAELINVAEELLHPAVAFEDGCFLFASADSPYHRRVPVPVCATRNIDVLFEFLDGLADEQERRRKEMQAQDEERARKLEEQRKEEQKRQEERRKLEEERRKLEEERRKLEDELRKKDDERRKHDEERRKQDDERKKNDDRSRKPRGKDSDDDRKSGRDARRNRTRGQQRQDDEDVPQMEAILDDFDDDFDAEPEVIVAEEGEVEELDVVVAEVPIDDEADEQKKSRTTRRGGRRHKKSGEKSESPRSAEPSRQEPSRQEPPRKDPPRQEPPRQEPPRKDPPRQEPPRKDPPRQEPPKDQSKPKDDGADGPKKPASRRGKRGGRRSPNKP